MRITGGSVFDLEHGFCEKDLCTDGSVFAGTSSDGEIVDASGCYVIPGLVDVHFHGCVGEDFSDATPEGLRPWQIMRLSEGVAYICPAGMTLGEDQLSPICKNAAAHKEKNSGGAELVGASIWKDRSFPAQKRGAQNSDFLHDPDVPMLKRLQADARGLVKLVNSGSGTAGFHGIHPGCG